MTNDKKHPIILLFLLLGFGINWNALSAQEENKSTLYKEFSLELNTQYRYFFEDGAYEGQKNNFISIAAQPELFLEWDDGGQLFKVTLFGRLEQHDSRRTHVDIRELYWQRIKDNWELSIGAKKIFWGVTESIHLVDIINQTDVVESFDGEEKLGQPMVHFSQYTSLGTFDLFAMPYFRKRQFPGREGRFRFPTVFDRDDLGFENDNLKEWYPSFAVRWSNSVGAFDVGLSHFYGVGREPIFAVGEDLPEQSIYYPIIHQTGLDLQAITGPALWKLESIVRLNEFQDMFALAAGLEYTFGNIASSGIDIGIIGEYLYDNRDELALSGMDNDVFIGSRLAFNDTQSTEILFGGIFDVQKSTNLISVEASRRFGNSWKVSLEARLLNDVAEEEIFYFFRNDSFAQLSISKFW